GGLAQALVEACLRRGFGAEVQLPDDHSPFIYLFSESTGRVLVSVRQGEEMTLAELAAQHQVPVVALGTVGAAGSALAVEGQFAIPLEELREAHTATLPALFS